VERILRAFPDYGKSPPEYVASLVQLMCEYPVHIQEKCADLRRGVASKTDFLPTIKTISEMADGFVRDEAKAKSFAGRFSGRSVLPHEQAPFVPFPQLWRAFENEPDLFVGRSFDTLDDACKDLVTQGHDAARVILKNNSGRNQAA
jgi:hypothetical protein